MYSRVDNVWDILKIKVCGMCVSSRSNGKLKSYIFHCRRKNDVGLKIPGMLYNNRYILNADLNKDYIKKQSFFHHLKYVCDVCIVKIILLGSL